MKKVFCFLFMGLIMVPSAFAQDNDNSQLFIDDMLTLAEKFAQPAADGAPYQAAAGWFSSAESLEKWKFRVSLHGNVLVVPEEKNSFSLQNSELKLLQIEDMASAELPTAFGANTDVFFSGEVRFRNPVNGNLETENVRFKGFDGVDLSIVPHAFAQVAVGLPMGTELTVRAMPEVTINGVAASTYGAGVKHSLSQYFGYNYPESFQLALGAAYSKIEVNYDYAPIEVNQYLMMNEITVDADLWLAELIASKKWGNFELFGAAGIMNSKFNYEMGGTGFALGLVNTELESLSDAETQFKGDLGFNLYFGRFRLSTMATLGEFVNGNVGLHVGI